MARQLRRTVSFDFDGTLVRTRLDDDWGMVEDGPNEEMIETLREHAAAGDKGIIVTSRVESQEAFNAEFGITPVARFVEEHELPVASIHFTGGNLKLRTLEQQGVTKHFDDDPDELEVLLQGMEGVLVSS